MKAIVNNWKFMEEFMHKAWKHVWNAITLYTEWRAFYTRFNNILQKYDIPCNECTTELEQNWITKKRFDEITSFNHTNIKRYCSNIGYMVWWIIDGLPIKGKS